MRPHRSSRSELDDEPPSSPARARAAGISFLGRRDYTVFELRARLTERGFAPDDIDAAVESLTEARALDDDRVARAHVRTASRIKGRGRLRITRELDARGVSDAVARAALDELPPGEDEAAIARFLARQRLSASLSPAERDRLFRRLLRKGFAADAIGRALRGRRAD